LSAESAPMWLGPYTAEAAAAFRRAADAGLTVGRALVMGQIASFQDCWTFRRRIAKACGVCVRTVQRAMTEAAELGLIQKHRSKKGEVPRGADHPVDCGWSHRTTIGWGMAAEKAKAAIAATRLARLVKRMMRNPVAPVADPAAAQKAAREQIAEQDRERERYHRPHRRWTAAELDAELARRDAVGPPDPA
jgi:hypothetical protein